jgi:hypothetical protein
VPLSIEITTKGEAGDRFEIQLEGIDPEWVAYPEPVFNVGPNETHAQKVFFKPPRASESSAGNYPFVAKVRSLESGEARTAQGVLQIKPFHHLSIELTPKKGFTSPMRHANIFNLTVMNLGNTEHTLQLSGSDPEEECNYDFESDQVTLGPGQQKQVDVTVNATNAGWVAPVRLFGFTIGARSTQSPNLIATTHGQLERRPLLTVGSFLTVILLLAAFLLWYAFRPQPATIVAYAEPTTVQSGQTVQIRWKATHADSVQLEIQKNIDGKLEEPVIYRDRPLQGSMELPVANEDTITVTASAVVGDKLKEYKPVMISVTEPPPVTPPKITKFDVSSRTVHLGDSIIFTFDYSPDTATLVLQPLDRPLSPPMKAVEVTPTKLGRIEYQLIARGKNGAFSTSKTISVEVIQVSAANILSFTASPQTVEEPESRTTVSWKVTNAAIVKLDDGSGNPLREVPAEGTMEIPITKSVTIQLIAMDDKKLTASQKLEIKYKPLPPPVTPDTTGDTGGGIPPITTGGGAGGTTGGGR